MLYRRERIILWGNKLQVSFRCEPRSSELNFDRGEMDMQPCREAALASKSFDFIDDNFHFH